MSEGKSFVVKVLAELNKTESLMRLKADLKSVESKLSKLKIQGKLDTVSVKKDINSQIKTIKSQIKVDADTSKASKKIKKLEKQKINTKITTENTKDNVDSKKAQKESETFAKKFSKSTTGSTLIRMLVQNITNSINQAIQNVKELDSIKTTIQTVSGTSDSEVNSMMKTYNDMAKDLSSTTKSVSEAANEFLSMGQTVETTNKLIESSQVLSKIGMIESAEAANYLMSVMKGYNITAKDSMDIVSKLASVDVNTVISTGGLAEAISKCADVANDSGTSIDRLIGYIVTVKEVTQDSMSIVGNSFKSMYGRMNNIKMGKLVDDETGESLSNTENVLNKLGIQLKDTQNIYRDFDDVLNDVGKGWKDFTDTQQDDISVAIAGNTQNEHFIALMNNYSNALKYSEMATNSAGTAMERYGIYQDSLEAKCNELTTAIESLSTNVISEKLYSGIVQATTGIVEFLDKTNLLKTSLSGLATIGALKTFLTIKTSILKAARSTAQLTSAMALFSNERSNKNLKAIGKACIGLNDSQLKLVLSTKNLEHRQQLKILSGMGVKKSLCEQKLATLGFTEAEKVAAASTHGFSTKIKGLKNTINTLITAHPVLLGVTAAIASLVGTAAIIDACTISFEELGEKITELQNEVSDSQFKIDSISSELNEITQKVKELQSLGTLSFTEEKELENLQKQKIELENMLNIEKERHKLAQNKLEKTAQQYLNKKSTSKYKEEAYVQKQVKNGQFTDVSYTKAAQVTRIEELRYAGDEMLKQQENINQLNKSYKEIENPTQNQRDEYENNLKKAENARDDAKSDALSIQEELQEKVKELDESSESYQTVLKATRDLSDKIALMNGDLMLLSVEAKRNNLIKNNPISNEKIKKEVNDFIDGLNDDDLKILMNTTIDENKSLDDIKQILAKAKGIELEVKLQVQELDPSDFLKSSEDKTKTATLIDLQEEADLLSSLSEELSKTGKIGTSSMQSIIEKYPEAKEYLGDYMLGIVSEAELFAKLQEIYAQDEQSYKVSLLKKAQSDGTFYQTLVANNQELFAELSSIYQQNFFEYKNLAQAKAEIDKGLVQELAGIWGEYYDVELNEVTGLYEITKKDEDKVLTADEEMALGRYQMVTGDLEVNKIRKLEEIRDRYNRIQKITLDQIDVNLDTSWEGLSGFDSSSFDSASGLEQDTSKDYDLIERAIQKLE